MSARKLRKRKDNIVYLNERDALWQYILDHSRPVVGGGFFATFKIKSREAFESSIQARVGRKYRYNEEQLSKHNPILLNSSPLVKRKKTPIRKFIRRKLQWIINHT